MNEVKGNLIISVKRSISPDLLWEFLHFFENGSVDLVQVEPLYKPGEYRRDELTFKEGIELAAEWLNADRSITSYSDTTKITELITL